MDPAVCITLLVVSLYSMVVFLLSLGLARLGKEVVEPDGRQDPVTLIIPFRDEQSGLPELARDLMGQTYPRERMTVVFVNDHSQDGSKAQLEALIGNQSGFSCLDLPPGSSGKKEAISFGLRHAASDWIIQTDADCRVGPRFIASHMAYRAKYKPDLVAGLVTTRKAGGGLLEALDRLDLLGLVGTGAGSFHFHRPVMCNGANLAYSRALYRETRLSDPGKEVASGDDMFLMIGARKLGKTLSFNVAREAVVKTSPADSPARFIAQRIRWGSKTVRYRMADIQLLALLVAATNLLILILPFLFIGVPWARPWLVAAFLLKTGSDFAVLFRATGYTDQRRGLWMFLPVIPFYYLAQLLILAGSLLFRPAWKGRGRA